SRLEFEASRNCDLVTVGELFGRSGYGIGIRKGLFWSEKITLDILEFHESGFMADLDEKWIWDISEDCPPDKLNSPQRLGLANLEGIFMMIVGGVILGIILIIIELLYEKYKVRFRKSGQSSQRIKRRKDKDEKEFENDFIEEDGVLERNALPNICQLCESNERINEKNHCTFCSETLLMTGCEDDKDANPFWTELNKRIEESKHIPQSMKSSSPKQWIANQMKINRFNDHEHISGKCPYSLSDNELKDMATFVEKTHLKEIPTCSCHSNALYVHSTAEEETESSSSLVSSTESKDIDTESIISGEFSCPLLKGVSGRPLQNENVERFAGSKLPDVIYTKKTCSDCSDESDDHGCQRKKVYYI
ncbi:Glutamate [NMDA] receptor subunit 1, partial [Armadillidium nasatum]